ncbi:MAG: DHA2 family efflux MFS transporter permease subunit [Anaerolineales bacterium]|nr:DHA2 family efflux MFS transporter permease subunit [Anaerolineales bacterium]
MSAPRSPGWIETVVLIVAVFGNGMVYLDQSALNVALPVIQRDLQADVSGLQWIIDIYILVAVVLLLVGGVLGDRYGRVRVFNLGLLIFVAASLGAGVSISLEMLIAMRALQGLGGALLLPGGYAIVNALVAPDRRGRVLGLWGSLSPLITLSGPLLGGWLTDHVTWRAIFFLNLPLGLVAYWVAARYVPESRDEQAGGPLDWPGVAALVVGLGGLLFALIEGPLHGLSDPLVLAALGLGLAGLAAFIVVERRSSNPMLPLGLFRERTFTGINLVTLLHYAGLSGVFFFLTLNLQQAQRFSAFQAGLAQIPSVVLLMLLSTPVGRLTDRIGAVPLMAAGILISVVGYVMFAGLGLADNYWTSFLPGQIVFGVGLGLMVVPLTAVAIGALESRLSGLASGVNTAITRVGQMVAVAVFGAVLFNAYQAGLQTHTAGLALPEAARAELLAQARNIGAARPPAGLSPELTAAVDQAIRLSFVDGFRQMMWIAAGLSLAAVAVLLVLVRQRPARPAAPETPAAGEGVP